MNSAAGYVRLNTGCSSSCSLPGMVAIVDHGGASSVAVGAGQVWKILPHGLFFVLRHPPLGRIFWMCSFRTMGPTVVEIQQLCFESQCPRTGSHPLLCVGEIVVSMRQISIAHKAAGGRSGEIREGNGVSPESVLSMRVKASACVVRSRGFLLVERTYRGSSCKATPSRSALFAGK